MSNKKNFKYILLRNFLVVVTVLIASLAVATFLEFWRFVRPEKYQTVVTPQTYDLPFENVYIKTKDNLSLSGWYIPQEVEGVKSAIIILHGYGASKEDVLSYAPFLYPNYNILLFDFRYFGDSEGKFTSFGFHERKDLEAAVQFLKEKGIEKIGILSFSMGASIALYSADTIGVQAIVAEAPYASVDLMAEDVYKNFSFLKYPVIFFSNIFGKLIIGATTGDISSERTIAGVDIPVFLIASEKDELITAIHFERLKKAIAGKPNSEVWLDESSYHGAVYFNHKDEYEKKVGEFFRKNLQAF